MLLTPVVAWSSNSGGNDVYTKLLLHCDGTDASTTFTDSSASAHAMTANGTAQIDTAQFKFGGASGLFSGASGCSVTAADSADWEFGSGDFTIDAWIYPTSLASILSGVACHGPDGNNAWEFYAIQTGAILFRWLSGGSIVYNIQSAGSVVTTGSWQHVAAIRNGTNLSVYVGGISVASLDVSTTALPDYTGSLYVGSGTPANTSSVNGWLDEVRISKGIARWTANFTPPTSNYTPYTA